MQRYYRSLPVSVKRASRAKERPLAVAVYREGEGGLEAPKASSERGGNSVESGRASADQVNPGPDALLHRSPANRLGRESGDRGPQPIRQAPPLVPDLLPRTEVLVGVGVGGLPKESRPLISLLVCAWIQRTKDLDATCCDI